MQLLACAQAGHGDKPTGLALVEHVVEVFTRSYPDDWYGQYEARANFAQIKRMAGDCAAARDLLRLPPQLKALGDDNFDVIVARAQLGAAHVHSATSPRPRPSCAPPCVGTRRRSIPLRKCCRRWLPRSTTPSSRSRFGAALGDGGQRPAGRGAGSGMRDGSSRSQRAPRELRRGRPQRCRTRSGGGASAVRSLTAAPASATLDAWGRYARMAPQGGEVVGVGLRAIVGVQLVDDDRVVGVARRGAIEPHTQRRGARLPTDRRAGDRA